MAQPNSQLVDDFWLTVSKTLHMAADDALMGADDNGLLTPPAWCFGDSAPLANQLLELVLSGKKTATSSALEEYAQEGLDLPQVGDLSIICDGDGAARALIRNTEVRISPFDQVGADVAVAEGEGDLSLRYWQEKHEQFFGGRPEVLTEFFTLVYPKK